jgi:hypothetical protein
MHRHARSVLPGGHVNMQGQTNYNDIYFFYNEHWLDEYI